MEYRRIVTKNGRIQYWANNKMVSVTLLPEGVKRELEHQGLASDRVVIQSEETVDSTPPPAPDLEQDQDSKVCAISGKPSDTQKFINGVVYKLNSEAIQGMTTGEIAEALRNR